MKRFRIMNAKTGATEVNPMFAMGIVSVAFGDEDSTYHLNLVESDGIPQFIASDEDIFDRLVGGEIEDCCDEDGITAVYDFNEFTEHDFNLLEDSYARIYRDCLGQPDNPASHVMRYIITLANFGGTGLDVDEYIAATVGKYVDEAEMPEEVLEHIMEDDDEWWEEKENEENE